VGRLDRGGGGLIGEADRAHEVGSAASLNSIGWVIWQVWQAQVSSVG